MKKKSQYSRPGLIAFTFFVIFQLAPPQAGIDRRIYSLLADGVGKHMKDAQLVSTFQTTKNNFLTS